MKVKRSAQGCATIAVVVFLITGILLFFQTSPENDRRGFIYMILLSAGYLVWTYRSTKPR